MADAQMAAIIDEMIKDARQRNAAVTFKLLDGSTALLPPEARSHPLPSGVQWLTGAQVVFVPYAAIAMVTA